MVSMGDDFDSEPNDPFDDDDDGVLDSVEEVVDDVLEDVGIDAIDTPAELESEAAEEERHDIAAGRGADRAARRREVLMYLGLGILGAAAGAFVFWAATRKK